MKLQKEKLEFFFNIFLDNTQEIEHFFETYENLEKEIEKKKYIKNIFNYDKRINTKIEIPLIKNKNIPKLKNYILKNFKNTLKELNNDTSKEIIIKNLLIYNLKKKNPKKKTDFQKEKIEKKEILKFLNNSKKIIKEISNILEINLKTKFKTIINNLQEILSNEDLSIKSFFFYVKNFQNGFLEIEDIFVILDFIESGVNFDYDFDFYFSGKKNFEEKNLVELFDLFVVDKKFLDFENSRFFDENNYREKVDNLVLKFFNIFLLLNLSKKEIYELKLISSDFFSCFLQFLKIEGLLFKFPKKIKKQIEIKKDQIIKEKKEVNIINEKKEIKKESNEELNSSERSKNNSFKEIKENSEKSLIEENSKKNIRFSNFNKEKISLKKFPLSKLEKILKEIFSHYCKIKIKYMTPKLFEDLIYRKENLTLSNFCIFLKEFSLFQNKLEIKKIIIIFKKITNGREIDFEKFKLMLFNLSFLFEKKKEKNGKKNLKNRKNTILDKKINNKKLGKEKKKEKKNKVEIMKLQNNREKIYKEEINKEEINKEEINIKEEKNNKEKNKKEIINKNEKKDNLILLYQKMGIFDGSVI